MKRLSLYYFICGLVILASFFIWEKICQAEPILKITNIQFESETSADDDFIEITNTTENKINLDGYKLVKKTSSGTQTSIVSFGDEDSISSGETYLWASSKNNDFPSEIGADIWREATIYKTNGIAIILGDTNSGIIIDSLNWEEEEEEEEEEEAKDYSGIRINEIYPAPDTKNGEEEFVEILNLTGKEIDFSDYVIKDSKGAKGKISKHEKIGNFIVFYGSFSFNNDSKGDTVFLYDKKENLITSQKYSNGKSAHSFSFDGSAWRWTSSLTPGGENFFDKILSGKLILPKKIYKNTYAYFNVKADEDAKKFTWNFGDGHKSYLKSTKHKYEKTGKFSGNLKITGDGEDKTYDFSVKVEKYDAPTIRIVSLSPNPKGSDTKNEFIILENNSKKKINLKGWSIATGCKKLINHPIREKFEIKAGKTKKLLRDICAFTLVNTKDKIELRDPSGKTVQKIKYDHGKKSISEDELYSKIDGEWLWLNTPTNTKIIENTLLPSEEKDEFNIPESEIQANLGKYSPFPIWQKKQKDRQILAYSSTQIIFPEKLMPQNPRVLGVKTTKAEDAFYIFTWKDTQKHWLLAFLDSSWIKINSKLNRLLLKI